MDSKSLVRYLATGDYSPASDAAPADIDAAGFNPTSVPAVAEDAIAKYLALSEGEFTDMKTHDDRFHGGHFDEKTMKCSLRRKFDRTDAEMDTLTGAERDRATAAENAEAMRVAADFYISSGQRKCASGGGVRWLEGAILERCRRVGAISSGC